MIRAADKWLPGYINAVLRRPGRASGIRHLMFCVADHFEPFRGASPDDPTAAAKAEADIRSWTERYCATVSGFSDSDGVGPRHTFFYPEEEYRHDCVALLAGFCAAGHGELEIHLHHRNDSEAGLREKLCRFRDTLRRKHGLLGGDAAGAPRYAFVHGNWALCNSRPDGDWCGVDEELSVLAGTGCFADFTFPSAPSPTQPRTVNSIYRATDAPGRPRGHDRGRRVSGDAGGGPSGESDREGLMLIQGPLALNWKRRKWGLVPRLECGEITSANPPTPARVDLWVRQGISVAGREEWVFVKVHCHGAVAGDRETLLGASVRAMHQHLCSRYNDASEWLLHYVSAREMYNVVRAAEDGKVGNPGDFRDYEVSRPTYGRG